MAAQLPTRRHGVAIRAAARSASVFMGSFAGRDLVGLSCRRSAIARDRRRVVTRASPQSGGTGKSGSAPPPPAPEPAPTVPMTFEALLERLNAASAAKVQKSARVVALEAWVRRSVCDRSAS